MRILRTSVLPLLLTLFCVPFFAAAHATPTLYSPASGVTELTIPERVSIEFTERIETDASSLTVFGPNGEEVQRGEGEVGGVEGRTFSIPIDDVGEGVYTISWQVVSVDDGHFTKGASSFLVDATGKEFVGNAGSVEILYVTQFPEAVFNFFGLLGESIFLAVLLALVFILKPLYRTLTAPDETWSAIRPKIVQFTTFGFITLLLGSIATILKKTAGLAELQGSTFGDVFFVYLASNVGSYTLIKIVLAVFFIAVFLIFQKRIFSLEKRIGVAEIILFFLIAGIMFVQSAVSHAAASHFYPGLSIFVTALHLFAKEFLIGGIAIIALCARSVDFGTLRGGLSAVLTRYDVLAAGAILIGGTTGVYVTWLHLKDVANLVSTEWGMRFILLALFALVFGGFRVLHQFYLSRRATQSDSFFRLVSLTLMLELSFGLIVLFYSGYISITTPPFTVEQFTYAAEQTDGAATIRLDVHPYEHEKLRLVIEDSRTGEALEPERVTVTATNRERGIGPNVLEAEARFPGGYAFERSLLAPPGVWHLAVILEYRDAYNSNVSFTIDYPGEIEGSKISDNNRIVDQFTQIMIIAGVMVAVVGILLLLHALWQRRRIADLESIAPIPHAFPLQKLRYLVLLVLLLFGVWAAYELFAKSDFERMCTEAGFEWRQAFPTRDFESVAPNAVLGCTVHDGHYHFIDEREYRAFLDTL